MGENGVDLSFESQDFISFGILILKNGKVSRFEKRLTFAADLCFGQVVRHEQRSDERKEIVKK